MKKFISIITAVLCLLMTGCSAGNTGNAAISDGIKVVTTVFPGYDWTANLMEGTGAVPTLLMKNGVDMHSFQPTAADIVTLSDADLFLYVGGESDDWVADALKNAQNENMIVLNMMEILADAVQQEEYVEGMEQEHEHENEDETEYDEHVWLSLKNAESVCKAISEALCEIDIDNAETYQTNAEAYILALNGLHEQYQQVTSAATQKTVLFGDRFPFLYLVKDYDLTYYAAFPGCSAETEASFSTISFLADKVDELSLSAVLTIDGSDQKIAKTIVENTASKTAEILTLDSMQSVTDQQISDGATYLSIMENNLSVLQKALS